jgi:hypothetical protein
MMKVVAAIVVLLISIVMGLLIFWEVSDGLESAFPDVTQDRGDSSDNGSRALIQGSRNTTNETAGTIFNLLPIIGIISVAAIMLMYVSRFGGGGI